VKKKKRILVVDDEVRLAFLLKQSLLNLGPDYEIETASSGAEALKILEQNPCDLVITDFRMRGMGGLELMRAIKSDTPETLIILMTAYGSPEIVTEAKKLKVYRYITKPFPIEEFQTMVKEAFVEEEGSDLAQSA
jgi:two-component system response regulator PilR (NtrC family)